MQKSNNISYFPNVPTTFPNLFPAVKFPISRISTQDPKLNTTHPSLRNVFHASTRPIFPVCLPVSPLGKFVIEIRSQTKLDSGKIVCRRDNNPSREGIPQMDTFNHKDGSSSTLLVFQQCNHKNEYRIENMIGMGHTLPQLTSWRNREGRKDGNLWVTSE